MKEKQEDEAAPEEKEGNVMSHNYSHAWLSVRLSVPICISVLPDHLYSIM